MAKYGTYTAWELCPLHVYRTRHHSTGETALEALHQLDAKLNECREEYERRGRVPYGAGEMALKGAAQ